jgi:hypothetical protein
MPALNKPGAYCEQFKQMLTGGYASDEAETGFGIARINKDF